VEKGGRGGCGGGGGDVVGGLGGGGGAGGGGGGGGGGCPEMCKSGGSCQFKRHYVGFLMRLRNTEHAVGGKYTCY